MKTLDDKDTRLNERLAGIFREMSSFYLYLGEKERFRALAYSKAAKVIGALTENVSVYFRNHTLEDLPGIGEGIAEKTGEYITTGKIEKYEQLKKSLPYGLMDLMDIRGFGPRSLNRIHTELDISDRKELIEALQDGRIAGLKNFGPKKTENMMRGLKLHKTVEDRMLLWTAMETADAILNEIKQIPGVTRAGIAGSLRRKKETIGDMDILVACEEKSRKKIMRQFCESDFVEKVLAKGETKSSILLKTSGKQVDLRIVNLSEWGAALQYFTGSKEHNIHLRTIAKEKGFRISEYGIFNIKNNQRIAGSTEESIYEALGFRIMPPEMREDRGEIELSMKHPIPKLVTIEDIKGDMQMHSNWSDGSDSIEDIARYVLKNFPYAYIVITDHSRSSRIANGLDEKRLLQQIKEIGKVNRILGKDFVKKGIEVDILSDGSLDLPDEILGQMDWVTASIHNNFTRDNTDRIISACNNPYVNCIGHPTGRLIGSREPYPVNMEEVMLTAVATHTALEINAQPERMDLNDTYTMQAVKHGVQIVISTDSHIPGNFSYMQLGVSIARRGWCTCDNILNTKSWEEIRKFRRRKLKGLPGM